MTDYVPRPGDHVTGTYLPVGSDRLDSEGLDFEGMVLATGNMVISFDDYKRYTTLTAYEQRLRLSNLRQLLVLDAGDLVSVASEANWEGVKRLLDYSVSSARRSYGTNSSVTKLLEAIRGEIAELTPPPPPKLLEPLFVGVRVKVHFSATECTEYIRVTDEPADTKAWVMVTRNRANTGAATLHNWASINRHYSSLPTPRIEVVE